MSATVVPTLRFRWRVLKWTLPDPASRSFLVIPDYNGKSAVVDVLFAGERRPAVYQQFFGFTDRAGGEWRDVPAELDP